MATTLAETIQNAATALVFFGRQVIAPRRGITGGNEIYLISPYQMSTFEPRFHTILHTLTAPEILNSSPLVPREAVPVSRTLTKLIACEIVGQFLNQLAQVSGIIVDKRLKFNLSYMPKNPDGIRESRPPPGVDAYAFHQDLFLIAIVNAAIYFAAGRFDATSIPAMLHGSFFKAEKLPLLKDIASWLAHVYHLAFSAVDEREVPDIDIYTTVYFKRLSEYIVHMPYMPQLGQVLRWVHRLDIEVFPSTDSPYMHRILSQPSSTHRNVLRLLPNSVPASVVDTEIGIKSGTYSSLWRGDSDWGPTSAYIVTPRTAKLYEQLMPFENTHTLMSHIMQDTAPTGAADAKGIEAGIFGLWRPNPLVKRSAAIGDSMQGAAVPSDMHTRKDVLKQVLSNHKLTQQDQQTDGKVRLQQQQPIATGMASRHQTSAAADPVEGFDEDQVYQERSHQITELVGSPLQTKPMPEEDWQKLITASVTATGSAGVSGGDYYSSGIHTPVPGATFY